MLNFILIALAVILITFGLVKLIDKFVPAKIKPVINIALWVIIAFLGYATFMSVYEPIKFNKVKEERFKKTINGLKVIRKAQLAHRDVTGEFSLDFDKLIQFIETAEYTLIERRDSSVIDPDLSAQFGVDMYEDIVVIDTIGTMPVKDSIFKNSNVYKTMMNLPDGAAKKGTKYNMNAGFITDSDVTIPVFEVFVKKDDILYDQNENLVRQENEVASAVVGVAGNTIKVGSMKEVETGGNWGKIYDSK